MQTNDNWATDNTQCLVPGYGAASLYTSGQIYGTLAPTSYPVTYDQKGACGQVVFTSDLVDKANANNVYGRLYAWKVGKGRAGMDDREGREGDDGSMLRRWGKEGMSWRLSRCSF